jgi:hypothetical protein
MSGPYDREGQAHTDAVTAAGGASWPTATVRRERLLAACADAGVELGAFDERILTWLAGYEPATVQVVADLIGRAYAAGRVAAAADVEAMPYKLGDEGWQALADEAVEASYDAELVRSRRRRGDFTTHTIEAAYQYGYRQAAKVARGGGSGE